MSQGKEGCDVFLISNTRFFFFFFKWQRPSSARLRRNAKNVQLETFEEQLDPPIVSDKNPLEALSCPLGGRGASAMGGGRRDHVQGWGGKWSGSDHHGQPFLGLLKPPSTGLAARELHRPGPVPDLADPQTPEGVS